MELAASGVGGTIKWMFVIIPVVFLAIAFLFALRYKLDGARFDRVVGGIKRLKEGQRMADFSSEDKETFELLTGKKADALWAVEGGDHDPPVATG
jgi:hypothetical protein